MITHQTLVELAIGKLLSCFEVHLNYLETHNTHSDQIRLTFKISLTLKSVYSFCYIILGKMWVVSFGSAVNVMVHLAPLSLLSDIVEKQRRAVNRWAKSQCVRLGAYCLHHPQFVWTKTALYRFDGVHFSQLGTTLFRANLHSCHVKKKKQKKCSPCWTRLAFFTGFTVFLFWGL